MRLPVSAPASRKGRCPGNSCQTAGGKGMICNMAKTAIAAKNPAIGHTSRHDACGPNRSMTTMAHHAAARTRICPETSPRDAPPANSRIIRNSANSTNGRPGRFRNPEWRKCASARPLVEHAQKRNLAEPGAALSRERIATSRCPKMPESSLNAVDRPSCRLFHPARRNHCQTD